MESDCCSSSNNRYCSQVQLIHPESVLQTERLVLEPIKQRHATLLYPILQDSRIYQYIPQEPPASVAMLEQRYQKLERRLSPVSDEVWLNWAVCLKLTGQYVGRVEASVLPNRNAYLAYLFGFQFWGNGYATEASQRILQVLFDDYDVTEVKSEVDTRNGASIRLLERLGFEQVEYRAAGDFFKGSSSDEYTYRRVVAIQNVEQQPNSALEANNER